MTVAVEINRVVATGNGVTTNWPFTFPVQDADDIEVYLYTIATDTVAAELNPVLYTVNGVPGSSGSVDYPLTGSPLAATHKIIIQRRVPMLQPLAFSSASGFDPEALTDQLDQIVEMIQQNADGVARAVKVNISGTDDPDDVLGDLNTAVLAAEASATAAALAETNAETAETNAEAAAAAAALSAAAVPAISANTMLIDNAAGNARETKSFADVRNKLTAAAHVATRTAMKALDTTKDTVCYLTEVGREGKFIWLAGDYSTQHAADTVEGVYVKATAIASTAGSWVRVVKDWLRWAWFGVVDDDTDTAGANTTALQVAISIAQTLKRGLSFRGANIIQSAAIAITAGLTLASAGEATLKTVSTSVDFLAVNTLEAVTFQGLRVTGPTVTTGNLITFTAASGNGNYRSRVIDCLFTGGNNCISWNAAHGHITRDCTFNTYANAGVLVRNTRNVRLSRSIVEDCQFYPTAATGTCILHLSGDHLFIRGNYAYQPATFLNVSMTTSQTLHNIWVEDNVVEDGTTGIYFNRGGATQLANVKIVDNSIYATYCINDSDDWDANTLADIVITGNMLFPKTGGTAISIEANPVVIANNIIDGGGQTSTTGIWIKAASFHWMVTGNLLTVISTPITNDAATEQTVRVYNNRGIDWGAGFLRQYARVRNADVSLTNNITTAQSLFASANDTLTVIAGKTYRFRARLYIATGTTTHTTAFGFGGTASITACKYQSKLWSGTSGTISTTAPSALDVTAATATVLNATSAAIFTTIELEGEIVINVAGTLIPQITFSAGPTGTCAVKVGSFLELEDIGYGTEASNGQWA